MLKRKKVLAVVIPIMLLTGCGGGDKVSTVKRDKIEQQTTTTKQVSKDDYAGKLSFLILAFDGGYTEYNKLLEKPEKDNNKLEERLDGLIRLTDELAEINPPNEFKDIQKLIVESTSHFKKSFELSKKANADEDKTSESHLATVKESEEELKKAKELWDNVANEVNKTTLFKKQEDSNRGSSITENDLNELGKKAGIDVNSVEKNTTKTGKEFVGSWGFEKDGKFIPTYILKEDKTFEVYSKDEYPSKKNYLTGTWSYDKDKSELKLIIKKAYQDGESFIPQRSDVSYKVQNFTDSKMQLFDGDTFQTYRFIKKK